VGDISFVDEFHALQLGVIHGEQLLQDILIST
jgi:hypothetical protein